MSISTPTTTDEIQVIHSATTTDAQIIVAMQQTDVMSGAMIGFGLLQEFETPPTLTQLRKRHPRDSEEYGQVMAFLGSCETIATFVKHGILDEALVNDLYWVSGTWRKTEKICKAIRKEAGEPRLFENVEWLANRAIAAGF